MDNNRRFRPHPSPLPEGEGTFRIGYKYAFQVWVENSVPSVAILRAMAGVSLVVLAGFLAYLPVINGGFVLDDDLLVTNNHLVKASGGLCHLWCTTEALDYWPLSISSFWIEWRLWGMHAAGYHVTNLVLHIVESLLIWIILRRMSTAGAFLAAMIFAVHPVNAESVAWIAQRKNLMAMLFFLLSILWYMKGIQWAVDTHANGARSAPGRETASDFIHPSSFIPHPSLFYWLSLAGFVLSMLCKGSVAVFPVLLLAIIWWLRPLRIWELLWIAPFFLVSAALGWVNMWFQTHGSGEVLRSAGFWERLLGAGGVMWFYLYKALLPIDLAFVYPQWRVQVNNLLWWLPLMAAMAVTGALWRYRKSWSRPFLLAWFFFCAALIPVMGFVDVGFTKYALVASRYQHVAIIGVIAFVAAAVVLWHRCTQGGARRGAMVVALAAVSVLVFLTWRQSGLYRDKIILYQAALEKNPNCWQIHNRLGFALFETGRPQEAIAHYQEALRLNPGYHDIHINLGIALMQSARYEEAIEQYEQALALKSDDPVAHNNLGIVLEQTGRHLDAIEHFQQAIGLNSDFPNPHLNLGSVLFQAGRTQEAIEHYKQALAISPDNPEAHNGLGSALLQMDRPEEAIEHIKQALLLRPDYVNACTNLAKAYAQMGKFSEAVAAAQKALELARSQGQTALAERIENWLNSHQGQGAEEEERGNPEK